MAVTDALYRLTATMPEREKSGLGGLIRKTIAGVPGKVADGVGGPPDAAAKPLAAAAGMLREVETMLLMGKRLKVFTGRETRKMRGALTRLDRLIDEARTVAAAEPRPAPPRAAEPPAAVEPAATPAEHARARIVIRPQPAAGRRKASWMENAGLNNHPKSAA